MTMPRFTRTLALAAALATLAACDMVNTVKDGMQLSENAAASIEKQLGAKPQVGFNYMNGSLASVSVSFATAPEAGLGKIEQVSRAAVVDAFKKEPDTLVVSFVFPKKT
jgi:hypothetical protein